MLQITYKVQSQKRNNERKRELLFSSILLKFCEAFCLTQSSDSFRIKSQIVFRIVKWWSESLIAMVETARGLVQVLWRLSRVRYWTLPSTTFVDRCGTTWLYGMNRYIRVFGRTYRLFSKETAHRILMGRAQIGDPNTIACGFNYLCVREAPWRNHLYV